MYYPLLDLLSFFSVTSRSQFSVGKHVHVSPVPVLPKSISCRWHTGLGDMGGPQSPAFPSESPGAQDLGSINDQNMYLVWCHHQQQPARWRWERMQRSWLYKVFAAFLRPNTYYLPSCPQQCYDQLPQSPRGSQKRKVWELRNPAIMTKSCLMSPVIVKSRTESVPVATPLCAPASLKT